MATENTGIKNASNPLSDGVLAKKMGPNKLAGFSTNYEHTVWWSLQVTLESVGCFLFLTGFDLFPEDFDG